MREGSVELTRRWVAALVMVAPEDREQLVAEIESRIVALYALPPTPQLADDDTPDPARIESKQQPKIARKKSSSSTKTNTHQK